MDRGVGISGNTLKIIAAISMFTDHMGLMFFPDFIIFRIAGRLAFPIFAYMIAEGCRHTKDKKKYFFSVACLGALCQFVYYMADGEVYGCVLVTFSLSILLIYTMQKVRTVLEENGDVTEKTLAAGIFITAVAAVYLLTCMWDIDYGFWGVMAPVAASVFAGGKDRDDIKKNIGAMGIVLLMLSVAYPPIQVFSLLSAPLLLCYSGKRGKYRMKYFFYIFYPLHLALLQGIYMLK